jgi:hypothetical protein
MGGRNKKIKKIKKTIKKITIKIIRSSLIDKKNKK